MKYKIWLKFFKKMLPGENFLCLRISKSNFRPFCGAKKQSFPYQWHSWWLWSDWWYWESNKWETTIGNTDWSLLICCQAGPKVSHYPAKRSNSTSREEKLLRKITKFIRHVLFPFLSLEISHRVGKRLKKSQF